LGILAFPFKALRSRHGMPFTGQAAFKRAFKQNPAVNASKQREPMKAMLVHRLIAP
jgi:hypothetical protein